MKRIILIIGVVTLCMTISAQVPTMELDYKTYKNNTLAACKKMLPVARSWTPPRWTKDTILSLRKELLWSIKNDSMMLATTRPLIWSAISSLSDWKIPVSQKFGQKSNEERRAYWNKTKMEYVLSVENSLSTILETYSVVNINAQLSIRNQMKEGLVYMCLMLKSDSLFSGEKEKQKISELYGEARSQYINILIPLEKKTGKRIIAASVGENDIWNAVYLCIDSVHGSGFLAKTLLDNYYPEVLNGNQYTFERTYRYLTGLLMILQGAPADDNQKKLLTFITKRLYISRRPGSNDQPVFSVIQRYLSSKYQIELDAAFLENPNMFK